MKFETFENRTHSQMSPKELIKYNTNEYDKQLTLFFFSFSKYTRKYCINYKAYISRIQNYLACFNLNLYSFYPPQNAISIFTLKILIIKIK